MSETEQIVAALNAIQNTLWWIAFWVALIFVCGSNSK